MGSFPVFAFKDTQFKIKAIYVYVTHEICMPKLYRRRGCFLMSFNVSDPKNR